MIDFVTIFFVENGHALTCAGKNECKAILFYDWLSRLCATSYNFGGAFTAMPSVFVTYYLQT